MYANKYSCIFSSQLEAIIHLYLAKKALMSRKYSPHNRKHHKKSLYLYLPGSTVSLLATPTTCFVQNNRLGHYPLSRITQSNYFRRKERKRGEEREKINACTSKYHCSSCSGVQLWTRLPNWLLYIKWSSNVFQRRNTIKHHRIFTVWSCTVNWIIRSIRASIVR